MRNPPWSRDELIIALEFYLRHAPSIPGKDSIRIAGLSDFLRTMNTKLRGEVSATYRNANGVYMKLMNFRRFDPKYEGRGLQRGNRDEEIVWHLFVSRRLELERVATAIRALVGSDATGLSKELDAGEEEDGEEGRILTRLHRYRERDRKVVARKKERVLKRTGGLRCEVCEYDFAQVYGDHGDGFIECHHTKPLSEMKPVQVTRLADLRLVCSNCHRMIHRRRPWLSIEQLQQLVAAQRR